MKKEDNIYEIGKRHLINSWKVFHESAAVQAPCLYCARLAVYMMQDIPI